MNIKAIFPEGVTSLTVNGLHQWDYGRKLEVQASGLPSIVEVHFACPGMTEAVVRNCSCLDGTLEAAIPDQCLEQTAPVAAWVYKVGETSGETVLTVVLPITARTRPAPSATIPESISNKYTELIASVQDIINSNHAATADHATTAGHATTADTAGHATTADTAGSATTAGHATTAGSAGTADHATTAGSADTAGSATTAGTAGTAEVANELKTKYCIDTMNIKGTYDGSYDLNVHAVIPLKAPSTSIGSYSAFATRFKAYAQMWQYYVATGHVAQRPVEAIYMDSSKTIYVRVLSASGGSEAICLEDAKVSINDIGSTGIALNISK